MQKNYYIGLILAISIIVVLSLGYTFFGLVTNANMQENSYSGDGFSFNIPPNWQVFKKGSGSNNVIQIVKTNSNTLITISKSPAPNNMSNQEIINSFQNSISAGNSEKKISNTATSINGNTAYETVYIDTGSSQNNEQLTDEDVLFIKNGYTYELIFEAPTNEFNNEQTNFNITLNSFKIQ